MAAPERVAVMNEYYFPPVPDGWRLVIDRNEILVTGAQYSYAGSPWAVDSGVSTEREFTLEKLGISDVRIRFIVPITEPEKSDKEWLNPWD